LSVHFADDLYRALPAASNLPVVQHSFSSPAHYTGSLDNVISKFLCYYYHYFIMVVVCHLLLHHYSCRYHSFI